MKKLLWKYKSIPVQVRASFWFLICAFFQKGISTITTPIFTRLLTTSEYGQYNVFNSWMGIVTIFVSLNLSWGVYGQGLVKFDQEKSVFTSSLEGLTTVLLFIWTIIYIIAHDFWNNVFSLTTVQVLSMFVMIWTSAVYSFWSTEQRVNYKYRALVIVTLVVSLAKPLIGIFLVVNADDKVTARILGLALVEIVGFGWLYFIDLYRGKVFYSKKFWSYALKFNLPLIPHYLSQTVLSSSDRIMIKNMTGAADAGIYSLAYSIALIMTLFNTALTQTINPWIYQKIKANRNQDIAKIAYTTLVMIAFLNLALIALAPEVIAVFSPESYYDAVYVIPPVAMSVYFMYMYDLFAKFAFYFEKTKFVMLASVIGAVLNIALNYICINLYGYKAAGYTTLVCYIIYCLGHYIFMNKVCDQFCNGNRPYEAKKLIMITGPFLGMGFILLFTYKNPLVRYGIILGAFIIIIVNHKIVIETIKKILKKEQFD